MGARFSNRRYGYVASVSISKLRGKHIKRDVACSDESRTQYSESDIVEMIYRYHDILQGKCDGNESKT